MIDLTIVNGQPDGTSWNMNMILGSAGVTRESLATESGGIPGVICELGSKSGAKGMKRGQVFHLQ